MTKAQLSAKDKADQIIDFLKENEPPEVFTTKDGFPIVDYKSFVSSHESALKSLKVLSSYWKAWYMRAYEAKQAIVEFQNKKNAV